MTLGEIAEAFRQQEMLKCDLERQAEIYTDLSKYLFIAGIALMIREIQIIFCDDPHERRVR